MLHGFSTTYSDFQGRPRISQRRRNSRRSPNYANREGTGCETGGGQGFWPIAVSVSESQRTSVRRILAAKKSRDSCCPSRLTQACRKDTAATGQLRLLHGHGSENRPSGWSGSSSSESGAAVLCCVFARTQSNLKEGAFVSDDLDLDRGSLQFLVWTRLLFAEVICKRQRRTR